MLSCAITDPEEVGFSKERLSKAVEFAIQNESTMDRDIGMALDKGHFDEPWPIRKTLGPVKSRKSCSGVILCKGKLIKTWGDIEYVDMTFSISKSYLALCMGIAVRDGIIGNMNEQVRDIVRDGGFDSEQNKNITWKHMLQLTSEWQGTLWDKPDWIDHYRDVLGNFPHNQKKGTKRILQPPGTYWEYNDVRVNRLSLALTYAFGRSIPEVLKEHIMDPIGASNTWKWYGYDNFWLELNGKKIQTVSGGAHWGGGLWISSLDHALVGQLMLNKGSWNGVEVIPETWIMECLTPCSLAPFYGYLWWLNNRHYGIFREGSTSAFYAMGVGTQIIYIDPETELVIVARWIDKEKIAELVGMILASAQN